MAAEPVCRRDRVSSLGDLSLNTFPFTVISKCCVERLTSKATWVFALNGYAVQAGLSYLNTEEFFRLPKC